MTFLENLNISYRINQQFKLSRQMEIAIISI